MTKKEFIERIENEIRDHLPEHIADNCEIKTSKVRKYKGDYDSSDLMRMLEEGNKSVDANDILSDEVFKYCYESNTFERIAA